MKKLKSLHRVRRAITLRLSKISFSFGYIFVHDSIPKIYNASMDHVHKRAVSYYG